MIYHRPVNEAEVNLTLQYMYMGDRKVIYSSSVNYIERGISETRLWEGESVGAVGQFSRAWNFFLSFRYGRA